MNENVPWEVHYNNMKADVLNKRKHAIVHESIARKGPLDLSLINSIEL